MTEGDEDSRIGYGRPPLETRFRKGQSGNPKGRPRKRKSGVDPVATSAADDLLRAELTSRIQVNEGGKATEMTKLAIVTRAQVNAAAKGNAFAQRDVLRAARELEHRDAERHQVAQATRQESFDALRLWKARRSRLWREAETRNTEPDEPWPHPDDILLDPISLGFRIRGPASHECLPRFRYYQAMRDMIFLKSVVAYRIRAPDPLLDTIWMIYDVLLPRRWQLAFKADYLADILLCLPARELRRAAKAYELRACEADFHADLPPIPTEIDRMVDEAFRKTAGLSARRQIPP